MALRFALPFVILAAMLRVAHGQAVLESDPAAALPGNPTAAAPAAPTVQWGLGVRARNVRLPQFVAELFVDRAPGSGSNFGLGLELVRRRGDVELQLGFEYEQLSMTKGIWIEKGKPIPENEVDFVEFDGFGWFSLEATALLHTPLSKHFALRYGAGLGLGVLFGEVTHVDRGCTDSTVDSCTVETMGGAKIPYDLPPVLPVINAVFGAQIRPVENMTINVEAGIRTLPFLGVSGTYFF